MSWFMFTMVSFRPADNTDTVVVTSSCSSRDKDGDAADVSLPFAKLTGCIGPAETANRERGATDKKKGE